jgi:hypothetical protein
MHCEAQCATHASNTAAAIKKRAIAETCMHGTQITRILDASLVIKHIKFIP